MKAMKKRSLVLTSLFLTAAMLTGCAEGGHLTENATSYAIQNNAVATTAMPAAQEDGMMYAQETPMYDAGGEFNTEEYSAITENGFKSVKTSPLSTFSTDIDTASYTNVRRYITDGMLPPPDAVRAEEIINYFNYDYAQPTGNDPVAITTELAACPWNDDTALLLVGLKTAEIDKDELPPQNLVFLIDVSGSMNKVDKLPLVQEAFNMFTETLDNDDRISIVTYASGDEVILEGASGSEKQKIMNAINSLFSGGSTAGSEGIKTAYSIAQRYYIEGGNNRIILATDGDLNVGITNEGDLKKLVEEKRDGGIMLSVLGFGTGNIKDNKMETLADNGNGSYHYIDSAKEAERVLVSGGAMTTVAKDVKLQIEFNPNTVKGYRLIGYENRALANEDFTDDTKDAGEMGVGMTVTALYELALTDSEQEIPETPLVYSSSTENASTDYATVSLRYKPVDSDESKLITRTVGGDAYSDLVSRSFVIASCAAEYAMLLRDSQYKGVSSYDYITEGLKKLNNDRYDDVLDEFITLADNAKRLSR